MSNLRIERYVPDLNEWMDITDWTKRRFPLMTTLKERAAEHARIYEMDVRIIQIKVLHNFQGERE